MAKLLIEDYKKSYGSRPVLAFTSMDFAPGLHWVQGTNGSGKTTFLASIAGVIPCAGNIPFDDGTDLKHIPTSFRRRVSFSEAKPAYPGFLKGAMSCCDSWQVYEKQPSNNKRIW